ncbi:uncharacterized protein LOC141596686 isoform X1 [Silene latifolia]|uniref:uncharacterized protein LOC141596686 isoform X1 n=1 Tax=Silene latifolia TaxID=37657 RepID=UPI003D77DEC0
MIYMMRVKLKSSYLKDLDNMPLYYVLLPCAFAAALAHPRGGYSIFIRFLWLFSMSVEAISVLPQLRLIQNAKYLNDLDDLRAKLAVTRATADASAASAQSAQFQFLALLRDLEDKDKLIMEHEHRVVMLAEQLDKLFKLVKFDESALLLYRVSGLPLLWSVFLLAL